MGQDEFLGGVAPADVPAGVPPFTNHLPVDIRFGAGAANELALVLALHGARRALLVIDDGLEDRVGRIAGSGVELARFAKPPGEPTIATVDEAAAALKSAEVDAVVAIGGGSVIDTAKAARLCAQQGTTFAEFLRSERASHRRAFR